MLASAAVSTAFSTAGLLAGVLNRMVPEGMLSLRKISVPLR